MPKTVSLHQLKDLAKTECKNEILLQTQTNTELHIVAGTDCTIIKLPFGNKINLINGMILIHEKK